MIITNDLKGDEEKWNSKLSSCLVGSMALSR